MDLQLINFDEPTEIRQFEKGRFEVYRVGPATLGRATYEPGWRWSEHVGPTVGAPSCQVEHVGLVLSGQAVAKMDDGTERVMEPGDFFYVPPGHDSWVVGDEPYVSLHILGSEDYALPEENARGWEPAEESGAHSPDRPPVARKPALGELEKSPMAQVEDLVDRYVAIWNEPDPHLRREGVRALWAEDAVHTFQPPQEVLDAASSLAVTAVFKSRGHAELDDRVSRAYEQFVASGERSFRLRGRPTRLDDIVRFSWEMVTTRGEVVGVGLEFLALTADGRIGRDYQFIEN